MSQKGAGIALLCAVLIGVSASAQSAPAPGNTLIARLSSSDYGWSANNWDFILDPPAGSTHGPIKTDPKFPYTTQIQNGARVFDPLRVAYGL